MPNRPNKHKRQRQNRQVRQARQARSAHAGEATAISRGEREAAAAAASPTSSGRATGKGKGAKPAPAKGKRESIYKVPGQRAVVMAFLFTLVSAGTLLFAPVQVQRTVEPTDPVLEQVDESDQTVNDDGTIRFVDDVKLLDEEGPAVAAGVMLTPILITGLAVWFAKRPQRSNAWTMAMIALAGYIFLFAGPYGIITLPAMIALAVGGFQSRRAENKERMAQIRAQRAARDQGEAEGEVIDVDATEDATEDVTDDVTEDAETVVADEVEGELIEGGEAEPVAEDDRR